VPGVSLGATQTRGDRPDRFIDLKAAQRNNYTIFLWSVKNAN
jgi:hypothetical protein